MTGYGRAQAASGGGHVIIEVRAVNHRYLDVRAKFPADLAEHAALADAIARETLQRGRIEITAKTTGPVLRGAQLDVERARAVYHQLQALGAELCPSETVPLSLLATVPDLYVRPDSDADEVVRHAVEVATRAAVALLTEMREAEGASLARDLSQRVATLRRLLGEIHPHTGRVVHEYREKLHKRIETLLSGRSVDLDRARLEHEVAAFADRADVSEELTRLASHCDQFEALVGESGSVGRKLDFLLQEMGREVNTTGSKIADVHVTRHVLDLKAELERMREQAQNVL